MSYLGPAERYANPFGARPHSPWIVRTDRMDGIDNPEVVLIRFSFGDSE